MLPVGGSFVSGFWKLAEEWWRNGRRVLGVLSMDSRLLCSFTPVRFRTYFELAVTTSKLPTVDYSGSVTGIG